MEYGMKSGRLACLPVVVALCVSFTAGGIEKAVEFPDPKADLDVKVELKNLSGEKKTNWPVILTVCHVFGRNIPAGTLNPKGYHVYNEKGEEIQYTIEKIPPYDQEGNNEIIFVVPEMANNAQMTYRITNTAKEGKQSKIDFVNNPNNLVKNPGFEEKGAKDDEKVKGWTGHAELDTQVKRSGNASFLLKGIRYRKAKYLETIPLHQGSRYYFGMWGKTDHVARHALYDSKGGYVKISGFSNGIRIKKKGKKPRDAAQVQSQCATRDWYKSRFISKGYSEWGVPEFTVEAVSDACKLLLLALDQRPQFVLPNGHCEGKWWLDDITLFEQPSVKVRHDLVLQPKLKDGLFVCTRPSNYAFGGSASHKGTAFCALPYPREKLVAFDRHGLKTQRVPYLMGIYATRPLKDVHVTLKGDALSGPGGAKLPLTEIEFCYGYMPPKVDHNLRPHTAPVSVQAPKSLPYFVLSFVVPKDAKSGTYKGMVDVKEGGKAVGTYPLTLRVQDMSLPVVRDIAVGGIFQGSATHLTDAALKQYSKTGYTAVTRFGGFFRYKKDGGKQSIDLEDLGKKLTWLRGYGITAAVTPFSDVDLGPLWGGGAMIKRLRTKEAFVAEVKKVEAFVKKNPDWPRIIWMTWDEPIPNEPYIKGRGGKKGTHGGANPMMGWPIEAVPDAWNTIDAGFWIWDKILPYYTYANFDEPANYCGPELYKYTLDKGKNFGFAASTNIDQRARYQPGMMMIASGARNYQYWHVAGHIPREGKVHVRALGMVAVGEGVDDLKIHRLMRDAIASAKKSGNAKQKKAAEEAEKYMEKVHAVWNADHRFEPSYPYLGHCGDWGYDQFYQDWQEQMARFAAACKGVNWLE